MFITYIRIPNHDKAHNFSDKAHNFSDKAHSFSDKALNFPIILLMELYNQRKINPLGQQLFNFFNIEDDTNVVTLQIGSSYIQSARINIP